jgi:spore coat polysaccharide biosynthesis protein SpsF
MIPAFVTVRTASSRLPRKCLLPFGEGSVLEHVLRRAKHYGLNPIVCTTELPEDEPIVAIAGQEEVPCFRGSVVNKLKRWQDCCRQFDLRAFHTVDADDPFFDGELMKRSFALLDKNYDVVCPTESSSAGAASVGYSLTREIVEKAVALAEDNADTEMMWYYLDKIKEIRKIILPESSSRGCTARLTLDYEEDYWLLRSVQRMVGSLATRREVDELFARNPDLYKIIGFVTSSGKPVNYPGRFKCPKKGRINIFI